jgi:ubiquinone/menaquinone biosynthesis C-methylase UbiE
MSETLPPVCDYEGSSYQTTFWDQGGREYEDRVEAIALRRLLPGGGKRMLEVGAGAGRNTPRYIGFDQIVLFDYSRTQLEQARTHLGQSERFVYVVGDVYRLPFSKAVFDAATMIRTLHHIADPARALDQIRNSLAEGSTFILEFANKRNLKAILRWVLRRQTWNPFDHEMVEFAPLNFNFHPEYVRALLTAGEFKIGRQLTVSHFRLGLLKRVVPVGILAVLDSILQMTGSWLQVTPSVFIEARLPGSGEIGDLSFRCPACGGLHLDSNQQGLQCRSCSRVWELRNGIYDFKEPLDSSRGS